MDLFKACARGALAVSALASTAAIAAPMPVYTSSVTVQYDPSAPTFCGPDCVFASASNNSSYTVKTGIDANYFYVDVQSTPNGNTDTSLQFANIYLGGSHVTNNLVVEVTNDRASTTDNPSAYTSLEGTGFSYTATLNDISFAMPLAFLENNPYGLNYGSVSAGDLLRVSYSQSFGYSLVAGANFDPVTRLGAQTVPAAAAAAVPETGTWAMMIPGMGAVGFAMRRRKAAKRVSFAG